MSLSLLRRLLGSRVFWSTLLSGGAYIHLVVLGVGLSRVAGKEVLGEWSIIYTTVMTLQNLAQLSMALMAQRYVAEFRFTDLKRVGLVLGVSSRVAQLTGVVCVLLLFFFADVIAQKVLRTPGIAVPLQVSGIYMFFLIQNGYQLGALSGFEKFRPLAIINSSCGLLGSLFSVWLALYWGLLGACIGMSLTGFANWLAHHFVLHRHLKEIGVEVHFERTQVIPLIRDFAVPATLAGVFTSLSIWLAGVALTRQSTVHMALFSIGNTVKQVVMLLPQVVVRVATSEMLGLKAKYGSTTYSRMAAKYLTHTSLSAAAVGIVLFACSPLIFRVYGNQFEGGNTLILAMCVVGLLEAVRSTIYISILKLDEMWLGFIFNALSAVLLVGLAWWFCQHWGALGLAYAYIGSTGFYIALNGGFNLIRKFQIASPAQALEQSAP